ncbi:MAG: Ig-like domain-containing protein [Aeromicrobium sp.]
MSNSLTASRPRRWSAVAAAGATALAGALVVAVASPAQAADVFITPAQLDTSETRATGHNDFVPDGVRVYTEGTTSTDKAAGYFAVNQDLATAGEPSMDSVRNNMTTTLKPGMQLVTDFDGNGTADGILVGEPTYADGDPLYGDNWWLSNGSKQFVKDGAPSHAGGFGSDNNGTLDQWRTAFPDADIQAFGWSLGSGVLGDDTIRSMTLGPNTYKFKSTGAPVVVDVSGSGPLNKPVTIALAGFDPDGGPVTYMVGRTTDGRTSVSGGTNATFRPKSGFAGTTSFSYTATDANGETGTGTVTVTIDKAPSTLDLTQRNLSTARNTAILAGNIVSAGKARGGTITVSEGGTTVATKVVGLRNYFRINLGSDVTSGEHTYDVTFGGSAQVLPSSGTVTLTVK